MLTAVKVVQVLILMLCFVIPGGARTTAAVSSGVEKANSGERASAQNYDDGAEKPQQEPPMKWGSLEINPHVITSSSTPLGLNVGVFVLPYIEAEPSFRTGDSGSAFAGKLSGNYVDARIGGTYVTPYVSIGYGLADINELDDDPVGYWTLGAGLKVFIKRYLAIRAELGRLNYEGSAGEETIVSLGLSFVPY